MNVAVYDGTKDTEGVKTRLREDPLRGFDLETVGFTPGPGRKVRLMQFSPNLVVDIGECGLAPFKEELEAMDLVAFGASFEAKWLRAAGISIDRLHCARLLHMATVRRAWGGRDKGGPNTDLKTLAKDYLGRDRDDKALQKSDWSGELSREQIEYAAQDAVDALELWEVFGNSATRDQLGVAYPMLRNALPCMVWMEETGLHMDFDAHDRLDRRLTRGAELAERKLQKIADINWQSGPQVGDWLMEHLPVDRLEKWPKTATGRMAVNSKVLRRNVEVMPRPFALKLLHSNRKKMVSTYGKSMLQHLDESAVLHGSLNQGGAVTGRPTSSKPNLLNMPRLGIFRRCFKAPGGSKLVIADYGQIEFRVASALAGNDPAMEDIFDSGGDIHATTAGHMFRKPPAEVDRAERQAAKATGFGILFGMGPPSLAVQLRTSEREARGYIDGWLQTFSRIDAYRQSRLQEAKDTGLYRFPSGRFIQWLAEAPPSQVYNYPVQGVAAELMYHALAALYPGLMQMETVPWIQVYDEVVLCAPDHEADMAAWILEQAMIAGARKGLPNINLNGIVEASIGQTWADKG